jgi:hypothetical protein
VTDKAFSEKNKNKNDPNTSGLSQINKTLMVKK